MGTLDYWDPRDDGAESDHRLEHISLLAWALVIGLPLLLLFVLIICAIAW